MGWSENQFWDSCLKIVFLAIDGFNTLEEQRQKETWYQAQFLTWHVILPYIEKGKHAKVKKQIFFFEQAAKELPKPLSKEEIRKRFARMDKDHKKEIEKNNGFS